MNMSRICITTWLFLFINIINCSHFTPIVSGHLMFSMQELARRFSLSFGLDLVKNREAVAAMHKLVVVIIIITC